MPEIYADICPQIFSKIFGEAFALLSHLLGYTYRKKR